MIKKTCKMFWFYSVWWILTILVEHYGHLNLLKNSIQKVCVNRNLLTTSQLLGHDTKHFYCLMLLILCRVPCTTLARGCDTSLITPCQSVAWHIKAASDTLFRLGGYNHIHVQNHIICWDVEPPLNSGGLRSLLSAAVWMQLFKIGGNNSNLGGSDC